MPHPLTQFYEFGPFCVDASQRLLARDGIPVPLTPKVFDTLLHLLQRSGTALSKDELMRAIWPDTNLSTDASNQYFCDGLAEELINALAKLEQIRVVARTSAFSFKGKETDIREIGRKLKVGTVLEGSVRKSGNRLRITVQLINAANGYHLWSERYDSEMQDIFDVQDEITLAVVSALKLKLLGKEKSAILKHHTDNPKAYLYYLKGQYYRWKTAPDEFRKCCDYFDEGPCGTNKGSRIGWHTTRSSSLTRSVSSGS